MKKLGEYMNGNTLVTLYEDGTKIMYTKDDEFELEFPTNMDIKITNCCSIGCLYCHERAKPNGKHAPISNFKFIKSLVPGTEVALGGGAITSHPKLEEILTKFKKQGVITNVTVHIREIAEHGNKLIEYQEKGLIHGIGVSAPAREFTPLELHQLKKLRNVVFHIINGVYDIGYLSTLAKSIDKPKLLILGYKDFGRGHGYLEKEKEYINFRQSAIKEHLDEIIKLFDVVSFDNLALEQLDIKSKVSKEEWEQGWQGEEGTMTFYIDAVKGEFAKNSISTKRYKITTNVRNMFRTVKKEK